MFEVLRGNRDLTDKESVQWILRIASLNETSPYRQHLYRQHVSHGSLPCRAMRETEALQKVPISIDTFDAEVACQAVAAGAHVVNDVSGGLMDPHMHAQVGWYCISVLMHLLWSFCWQSS